MTTTNNKMVNVMTQTDYVYPLGEYTDKCDIPEYIYQFIIDQKDQ